MLSFGSGQLRGSSITNSSAGSSTGAGRWDSRRPDEEDGNERIGAGGGGLAGDKEIVVLPIVELVVVEEDDDDGITGEDWVAGMDGVDVVVVVDDPTVTGED